MHTAVISDIMQGVNTLVDVAGTNSREKGFHEDWPDGADFHNQSDFRRQLQLAIVEKLALVHEEVSEAVGEIRSGHAPTETYYRRPNGSTSEQQMYFEDKPLFKPEGFGIELADAAIRIADLAYLTGIDLGALVIEKAEYNATRPRKHGREF